MNNLLILVIVLCCAFPFIVLCICCYCCGRCSRDRVVHIDPTTTVLITPLPPPLTGDYTRIL